MTQFFTGIVLILIFFNCSCQEELDSTNYKRIKEQLIGCWKTKHYQFKYENSLGGEYKSYVRSSAPIFKLIIKDGEVYLQWLELTGGEYFQKVISIDKKRLTLENEDKVQVIYKRNKNCSSLVKGVK